MQLLRDGEWVLVGHARAMSETSGCKVVRSQAYGRAARAPNEQCLLLSSKHLHASASTMTRISAFTLKPFLKSLL